MRRITVNQLAVAARARRWFTPERPGPLVGAHVIRTATGSAHVDRWPSPRAVLVEAGGNLSLAGDPAAFSPRELRAAVRGFLDVPAPFASLVERAFPDAVRWPRRVFMLPGQPRRTTADLPIRRLTAADAGHLARLSDESVWISKSWDGPARLAASGTAWGAFDVVSGKPRLVSVACPFSAASEYEDLGVVTEPEYQGRGLSTACAGAVCADILARGRVPSWTTSPDNIGSLRVAEKLGFQPVRSDELLVVGIPVPPPAPPPERRTTDGD